MSYAGVPNRYASKTLSDTGVGV